MSEESKDRDLELARKAVAALGEHFDSVQLFCTRHEPATENGTTSVNTGIGNWFARYGQVKLWVANQEEREHFNARDDHEKG